MPAATLQPSHADGVVLTYDQDGQTLRAGTQHTPSWPSARTT